MTTYTYTTRDGQRVEVNVAAAFDKLAAAFAKQFPGLTLHVTSGTRTRAEQQALYNGWIAHKPGFNLAAAPGYSNHEEDGPIGPVALDLHDTGSDAGVAVVGSARSNWLKANALTIANFKPAGFGFTPQEAWHYEYQGHIGGAAGSTPAPGKYNQTVANEQNFLNQARGEKLTVDGIAGPLFAAAVKRYQTFLKGYGYTGAIDGIWGAGTQAAHAKYYAVWSAPKSSALSYADIQRGLNKFGYNLAVDGVWGPKSHAALGDFQKKHGLTVDYIVGPATRAKLGI